MDKTVSNIISQWMVLKKNRDFIYYKSNLSLLESKCDKVLIANAIPDMETQSRFSINLSVLWAVTNFCSNDREAIRNVFYSLWSKAIEWIGVDKKGRERKYGVLTHIIEPEIDWGKGIAHYGYGERMLEHYRDPEVYSNIDMIVSMQFDSKYTEKLYDLLVGYVGNKKYHGLSKVFTLEELRDYLGATEPLYKSNAEFKRRIILPALDKLNKQSGLIVTIEKWVTEGKKMMGIQFRVKKNNKPVQMKIPWIKEIEDYVELKNHPIIERCVAYGIGRGIAFKWLMFYEAEYMVKKLDYMDLVASKTKIKNTGVYLVKLINNNEDIVTSEELQGPKTVGEIEMNDVQHEVADFIKNLGDEQRDKLFKAFREETQLYSLPPLELREYYMDWVAEKEDMGNPYPSRRAMRHSKTS